MSDLDAAAARYGRAIVAAETRGHLDTERGEMAAELQMLRAQRRQLTRERDAWRREAITLRRRVYAQGQIA